MSTRHFKTTATYAINTLSIINHNSHPPTPTITVRPTCSCVYMRQGCDYKPEDCHTDTASIERDAWSLPRGIRARHTQWLRDRTRAWRGAIGHHACVLGTGMQCERCF